MSNLEKAQLHVDGDRVDITVPIIKVKPEKRIVVGIATTDAVDHANEVVTFAASKKAFANTQGLIRTQHEKTGDAVGKIVKFEAKTVWNEELKKVVNAIEVEAYISETEEDVWTKAKEGLYGGFSIGGYTKKSEERIVKDADGKPTDKLVKYITDYELTELSLVDRPCNPLATIIDIQKSAGGDIIKGLAAQVETENVFWNATTKEFKVDKADSMEGYENIGWIETAKALDDDYRSEQLGKILQSYLSLVKSDEGGVTNVSEKEVTTEEVVEEVPTEVEEPTAVETHEEVEETTVVEEVPAEETDIKKMLQDLRSTITDTITKAVDQSNQQQTEALADVNDKISKAQESLTELSALGSKYEELSKAVDEIKEKFGVVEKRFESLETETAIKKSSDLGGSTEISKKKDDLWADSALSMPLK